MQLLANANVDCCCLLYRNDYPCMVITMLLMITNEKHENMKAMKSRAWHWREMVTMVAAHLIAMLS